MTLYRAALASESFSAALLLLPLPGRRSQTAFHALRLPLPRRLANCDGDITAEAGVACAGAAGAGYADGVSKMAFFQMLLSLPKTY